MESAAQCRTDESKHTTTTNEGSIMYWTKATVTQTIEARTVESTTGVDAKRASFAKGEEIYLRVSDPHMCKQKCCNHPRYMLLLSKERDVFTTMYVEDGIGRLKTKRTKAGPPVRLRNAAMLEAWLQGTPLGDAPKKETLDREARSKNAADLKHARKRTPKKKQAKGRRTSYAN